MIDLAPLSTKKKIKPRPQNRIQKEKKQQQQPLFTLGSAYSTSASGTKQTAETN